MRSCISRNGRLKRKHREEKDAIKHLEALRLRYGTVDLEPYRCEWCKYWHLGKSINKGD